MDKEINKIISSNRLMSIDLFRGLTILTMVFVNDLARVTNIPSWMRHAAPDVNGMTFVDVVFPAFLFIVGMSIPYALRNRFNKGETLISIIKHIFIRAFGLLLIGVYMVNMESMDWKSLIINGHIWIILLFLSVILVWNSYPKNDKINKIYWVLRLTGIILLIFIAVVYKGKDGDSIRWMRTSWWGILGLIGWAYLTSSIIYIIFRNQIAALMGMITLLILLFLGDAKGSLDFLGWIKNYIGFGSQIGSHSSITLSGIIVSLVLMKDEYAKTELKKIYWIILFGLGLFAAGYLLYPYFGISKNNATPTWCLYSSGISCFIFAFLYWLIDIKKINKWTFFILPTGTNPLLAYIIPYIVYSLFALLHVNKILIYVSDSFVGIIRSLCYTSLILLISNILTHKRIILKL